MKDLGTWDLYARRARDVCKINPGLKGAAESCLNTLQLQKLVSGATKHGGGFGEPSRGQFMGICHRYRGAGTHSHLDTPVDSCGTLTHFQNFSLYLASHREIP